MLQLLLLLLGSFYLALDEEPVTFLWSKTQALLAFLSVEADQSHRRDALAAMLWPDLPDADARNNLRQALHQLNQALGEAVPPFLRVTLQTVQFNRSDRTTLDVAEFLSLTEACRRHPHRRAAACPACVERLERAAALYRGEFLAGFSLKDSAAYDEWAMGQRERLRRLALVALHTLADHYALVGDYERMEQVARRQVEIDPFYEKAHRQVLKALAWSGQENAALAYYAALARSLEEELDAPPEDATTALIEQIRDGTLPSPAPAPLRNWPGLLSPLIGRGAALAALADLLQQNGTRLVTIVGTGGIGKTRLALAVGEQEAASFANGACFVPLAAVPAADFIVPAIATALDLPLTNPGNPLRGLCGALREREILLILDSMEHLLDGAALVTDLLAACPRLQVLVTSREPLHLHAEQCYPLPPLGLPDWDRLPAGEEARAAEVAKAPAVALFCLRAQAAQPGFSLDAGNATTVGQICTRLDGLPLALELAAAHVPSVTLPEMLTLLDHRLALLVDGFRDVPPRQRTLRATLDWSYALLPADEQQLLARLAVFAGGCTLETAQEVCGSDGAGVQAGLQALVEKGLLQRGEGLGGKPWFSMLETVHEYARERLEESGEQAMLLERHARYYVALAGQAQSSASAPGEIPWEACLKQERSNLRAVLAWAIREGKPEVGLGLGGALWKFWDLWGDHVEGRHWLEAVLNMPSLPGDDPFAAVRARVLTGTGVLVGEMGNFVGAIARLEEGLATARQLNDATSQAVTLACLGWVIGEMGDYERASAYYQESLALNRQRGGRAGQAAAAFVLNGLGNLAARQEDFSMARACYEEGLASRREMGDDHGAMCSLANLGMVAQRVGDLAQARRFFRESLALASELENKAYIAYDLFGLAVLALAGGRVERAVGLFGQAEILARFSEESLLSYEHSLYESSLAEARARLGAEAFDAAWAQGQAVPLKQAVAEALAEEGAPRRRR